MMRNGYFALRLGSALGAMLIWAVTGLAQDTVDMQNTFEQKVEALEQAWTAGGNPEYFLKAKSLANELQSLGTDPAEHATELLEALLSKNVDSLEVGAADLSAKASAAREILNAGGEPSVARQEEVKALAAFLGAVRRELVPNFIPRPVKMNVKPPIGTGPRVAGMDPNSIADPVARDAYRAARLENSRNAVLNTRQLVLQDLQVEFSEPIVDRMKQFANTDAVALSLVQEWVQTANLTDSERAFLFDDQAK